MTIKSSSVKAGKEVPTYSVLKGNRVHLIKMLRFQDQLCSFLPPLLSNTQPMFCLNSSDQFPP